MELNFLTPQKVSKAWHTEEAAIIAEINKHSSEPADINALHESCQLLILKKGMKNDEKRYNDLIQIAIKLTALREMEQTLDAIARAERRTTDPDKN